MIEQAIGGGGGRTGGATNCMSKREREREGERGREGAWHELIMTERGRDRDGRREPVGLAADRMKAESESESESEREILQR